MFSKQTTCPQKKFFKSLSKNKIKNKNQVVSVSDKRCRQFFSIKNLQKN